MSNYSSALEFQLSLQRSGEGLRKRTRTEIIRIVQNLFTEIVAGTPIDTGVARSNWNLSSSGRDTFFSDQRKDFQKSLIEGYRNSQVFKLGDTIHITNATHYIRELEYGKSKQAPMGWVRIAVERTRRRLR